MILDGDVFFKGIDNDSDNRFTSTWKSLKIAVGPGKSLNFNANFIIRTPKEKEQTEKDLQVEITHVVEELKKTDSNLSAPNGVLGKWKMVLESL